MHGMDKHALIMILKFAACYPGLEGVPLAVESGVEGRPGLHGPAHAASAPTLAVPRTHFTVIRGYTGGCGVGTATRLTLPTIGTGAHSTLTCSISTAQKTSLVPGTSPVIALTEPAGDLALLAGRTGAQPTGTLATATAHSC